MISLKARESFSLRNYHKVAWLGEGVAITESTMARIDEARASFLSLLESDHDIVVYGVTSGYGQNAYQRFNKDQRQAHARKVSFATSVAFGDPAPERVVRGVVFARLVNFIEGHAAVSSDLVDGLPRCSMKSHYLRCQLEVSDVPVRFSLSGTSSAISRKSGPWARKRTSLW